MSEVRRLSLREGRETHLAADDRVLARALVELDVATVEPGAGGGWRVTKITKVGVLRLGDVEVRIEPKTPIRSLLHLLACGKQWGRWFDEDVRSASIDQLFPSIAEAYARALDQAIGRRALRSYVEQRVAEPAVRGRWLVGEQLRSRSGLPTPVELAVDELTVDIPENQLLRAAVGGLLSSARLPAALRGRLLRADHTLADAVPTPRGTPAPQIRFDRRNAHYGPAVELARLVHEGGSLEHRDGQVHGSGYLLDLPRVFEEYVSARMTAAAAPYGGTIVEQRGQAFDRAGLATIRPDLTWMRDGRPVAVFDAKYKIGQADGRPNADLYQAFAYAARLGLASAHLIYAAGRGPRTTYEIGDLVTIVAHSVDLASAPERIDAQIMAIAEEALRMR